MNLHKEFVRLGKERRTISNELVALLPEIYRLRIYEQKGYATIYDYAARIAGLSTGVVAKALKVAKLLEDKPILKGIKSRWLRELPQKRTRKSWRIKLDT